MKKFIAAFDGLSFSTSTMNYAIYLSKYCNAHLVGVFLEDFTRHSYTVADVIEYEGENFDRHVHELNEKDEDEREENIELFEKACQNAGLTYSVHKDKNVAIQDLLHESIYADLLIINSKETLARHQETAPTRFIRELLNDVQCPVVVVPPRYKHFDKVILLYDGGPSSVYAARTFGYLFDSMKQFTSEVLTVKGAEESLHVPDNKLMKEFIKRHYPEAEYVVLRGNPEDEVFRYLHHQKGEPIVVLGAYSRSKLSRLLKPSMADYILQHIKMPLFIAHR